MLARIVGRCYKYSEAFKQGWNDVPIFYVSLSIGISSVFMLVYRIAHTPPGGYVRRFKERYMVMRPDDDRLVGYPKHYVTDNDLLK